MNLENFWDRVDKTTNCWNWMGSRSGAGYGNLRLPNGKVRYAHRTAYELAVGPIPDGLVIDHLCRNRACVNPAHLEPVTTRENVLRGGQAYGQHKTSCPQGHDITVADNVRITNEGHRRCRLCEAVYKQRRKQRKEAA